MKPLDIAILGTRGIPANYGGFETFAEELSVRLVNRGHRVTVYGRAHYVDKTRRQYRGVNLVVLPAMRHKYLDTVSHTFLSMVHLLLRRADVVLVCNAVNAVFCLLPRLTGRRVVLNVDGLERKRKKWNRLGRAVYRLSERLSCFLPHEVVTDARTIQQYYQTRYNRASVMIPYGADTTAVAPGETLDRLGLEAGRYCLYVSRLEPENNAHLVVRLYEQLKTAYPLVVVGDAPYSRDYIHQLKQTKDPRIRFPGGIYGTGYRELISSPFCYIHATEVGGTHPALIENMAQGNLIFYLDTPENREVAGDTGIPFQGDPASDPEIFQQVLDHPDRVARLRHAARERAQEHFDWDKVTDDYLGLFQRLC
jgi:glycosyltransferase involved in cell wall biosynthesis